MMYLLPYLNAFRQVAETAERIAGDDPLKWALVAGYVPMSTVVVAIWKAYRAEAADNKANMEKSITAVTTAVERYNSIKSNQQDITATVNENRTMLQTLLNR